VKRPNFAFIVGAFLAIGILAFAVLSEIAGRSVAVFVHPVALAIVVGGSVACALMSTSLKDLGRILQRTYYAVRYPRNDFIGTIREIVRLNIGTNKDVLFLERVEGTVENAMLKDAVQLMNMGFKADEIRRFLEVRREQNEHGVNQCSILYFGLAKLGPALGLVGTLIGLVVLLYYHMGGGNVEKVASSMGVALTATLYGVGLANLLFGPLSEYMQHTAEKAYLLDTLVIEGAVLIKERRYPVYLLQALKSYVPREDFEAVEAVMRLEVQQARGAAAAAAAAAATSPTASEEAA
jgi:chemotaxis protein MotA